MEIKLSLQQKALLRQKVISIYMDDFDEELSEFKADQILDAFMEKLAPTIYNTAIEDMKAFIMNQLEDVEAVFSKK